MLVNNIILKIVTCLLIPYYLIFGLYVQIFGEVAPGGGFQAGAILASALIAYDMIFTKEGSFLFSQNILIKFAALGVLIYGSVGIFSIVTGNSFLNYYYIPTKNPQATGIMLVEIGVGITVTSVLSMIYQEFKNFKSKRHNG